MNNNFHKVQDKGMDQFFDPVGDEQTPTYILSSHQEIDMIENNINKCVGCDNSTCTCEGMVICTIGDTPNPVLSSHQKTEMLKMNEAIIETQLETVDSDKSFKASYACGKDGLTTLVPLGTPVSTIRCLSCGSAKFMRRIFDDEDDDRDMPANSRMETIESMKPQFRQHLKYDAEANDFKLITAPDDERGLGSFDPTAVMGYSQPHAIMEAYNKHYDFIDRNSGLWTQSDKSVIESLIDRVREQRIDQEDVFAREANSTTSVLVPCDVPSELKVDINNGKGMESFYMDIPDMMRRVKVLVTLPENKAETYKREQREFTRKNIIENKAKKTNRILSVDQTINNMSINTANKYVGAKPRAENTTTEKLGSAQKALFWASTPESKLAIKEATNAKSVKSVLVPVKERMKEFQKAMEYIMLTTVEIPRVEIPVTAKSDKKAYSNVSFMGEDSVFNNIETGYDAESLVFNIYDYEVTQKVTSINTPIITENMPKPRVEEKSTNSDSIQRHLSSISKIAKCESFIKYAQRLSQEHQKPKSNDNSSVVAKEATPSPLSNNQINILPSHQETDMKIKLAIVGTSKADPSAYQAVYDRVKSEMDKVGKDNLEIVSGGAKGIDSIGAQVAKDLGLSIKEFLPKEQSKEYFLQRNKQIAEYCTHTVAFVNKLTSTKCYHHGKELANHERTGGCYVGRQLREQGKDNYETIVLN